MVGTETEYGNGERVAKMTGEEHVSERELRRNDSGYYDPTAYEAIKNMKEEEKMELHRGDIYMCQRPGQEPTPYLNITAEGRTGMFASMIMLTEKEGLVYGVPVTCQGMKYASCDLVLYMRKDYLTDFIKCATEDEMAEVDRMVADALGLAEMGENEPHTATDEVARLNIECAALRTRLEDAERENYGLEQAMERVTKERLEMEVDLREAQKQVPVFPVEIEKELLKAETQRDMYKELYEQMLEKMIG